MAIPILPISLLAIGLSLVAMELAVPGLYLAALGAGALASGLVGYFYGTGPLVLLVSLSGVSVVAYLFLSARARHHGKK